MRGEEFRGLALGIPLSLFFFLPTTFLEKALIGNEGTLMQLGLERFPLRAFRIEQALQTAHAGCVFPLQGCQLALPFCDLPFERFGLGIKSIAQITNGGLDFRIALGLAGGEGLTQVGKLIKHFATRFRGRGGRYVERLLDRDERVIDPPVRLIRGELQPPTAGLSILEWRDFGCLERRRTVLGGGCEPIGNGSTAQPQGDGQGTHADSTGPGFCLTVLERVEAFLKIRIIGHGQLLT